MPLLPTIHGRGTTAAKPAAAAANEGYLYQDTTLGRLERSNGTTWDVVGSSAGLSDMGTATYLDFTTAAAPANPAAGKIRVYSKTGDTLSQRTSGGVETVFGAGGGGGLAQSYVGYNTIGGTWTAVTANRQLMKKVTLAATSNVQSVEVYLRASVDNWGFMQVGLLTDLAGVPDLVVGVSASPAMLLSNATTGLPHGGRWVSVPLGVTVAAGDYWLVVNIANAFYDIANDAAGADDVYQPNGRDGIAGNHAALAKTTGTVSYSIRASILS